MNLEPSTVIVPLRRFDDGSLLSEPFRQNGYQIQRRER
jgi:hypothetical protein